VFLRQQADEPPYQDVLEATYLDDPNQFCMFHKNGAGHYIMFWRKEQMSLDYQLMNEISDFHEITRRPLFVGPDDVFR
jgi:hypothetical protein